MSKITNGKQIKITQHAKLRLRERVPEVHPNNYKAFVKSARYTGYTMAMLTEKNPKMAKYVKTHFKEYRSYVLRVKSNNVFVFGGDHDRTLITVMKIPYKV